MRAKSKYYVIFSLGFVILLNSCSGKIKKQQKAEWLEKEVKGKIIDHRVNKMADCQHDILREAEIFVDSLISNNDLFSKIIEKIPAKPSKPEYVRLDSAALKEHRVNPIVN